jgi:aspartate dehydrogenase
MIRIGLIGFGFIGQYLYKKINHDENISIAAIVEPDLIKTKEVPEHIRFERASQLRTCDLDLVVEVADSEAMMNALADIPDKAGLLIGSLTSLADRRFFKQVEKRSKQTGRPAYIPHGAILGLDGVLDGRKLIDSVTITTRKPPKSLNIPDFDSDEARVVFKGTTREACFRFPRNVNSHAAIALAGIGFDRSCSAIIADPHALTMTHEVEISGKGLHWLLKIESPVQSRVTGTYAPESFYQSIKRIFDPGGGLHII